MGNDFLVFGPVEMSILPAWTHGAWAVPLYIRTVAFGKSDKANGHKGLRG